MDSRLRVLFTIHHELNPNAGVAGATLALGQALSGHRISVSYVSFDTFNLKGKLAPIKFPWHVRRYVLQHASEYDVIDATTGDLAWVPIPKLMSHNPLQRPLLVTRSHGLEHVWVDSMHEEIRRGYVRPNPIFNTYSFWYRLWEVERSLKNSDGTIFLNQGDLSYSVGRLGITPSNCVVIGNAVSDALLKAQPHSRKTDLVDIVLLNAIRTGLGTPHATKGYHYVFPILKELLLNEPRVRVSFLGSGKDSTKFLHSIFGPVPGDRLRISEGYQRTDLPQLLSDSKIFLMPSLSEGWSLALAEAMAFGLVPIAFDNHGTRELIRDGENGFLVNARNADAIMTKIRLLMNDDRLCNQLGNAARTSVEAILWDRRAQQTINFYEQLLTRMKM